MASVFDKNLLPEFDSVKDDNEEILWSGKPKLVPYIVTGAFAAIMILVFGVIWLLTARSFSSNFGKGAVDYFWLFGFVPIVQGLYVFLKRAFSFSNTAYAYSNKRVMMRTGFIGTDFKTIDYDKISDIEVTVNVIERMYNVGTIRFFSGRTQTNDGNTTRLYDSWNAIENPYEVFKMLKKTSIYIKSDISYPNALRPEENPGYNTKYNPGK